MGAAAGFLADGAVFFATAVLAATLAGVFLAAAGLAAAFFAGAAALAAAGLAGGLAAASAFLAGAAFLEAAGGAFSLPADFCCEGEVSERTAANTTHGSPWVGA